MIRLSYWMKVIIFRNRVDRQPLWILRMKPLTFAWAKTRGHIPPSI